MTRNRSLALILVSCSAVVLFALSTAWASTAPKQAKSNVVATAKIALASAQASYGTGQAAAEDVYRWSRRLMIAEFSADSSSKTAQVEHAARMRTLRDHVAELHRVGAEGGDQLTLDASAYYLDKALAE